MGEEGWRRRFRDEDSQPGCIREGLESGRVVRFGLPPLVRSMVELIKSCRFKIAQAGVKGEGTTEQATGDQKVGKCCG